MNTQNDHISPHLASYTQSEINEDGVTKAYQFIFKKMIELRAERGRYAPLKTAPSMGMVTGGLSMCECI